MNLKEFFLLDEIEINYLSNLIYFASEFEKKMNFFSEDFLQFLPDNKNQEVIDITDHFNSIFDLYIKEDPYNFVKKYKEKRKKEMDTSLVSLFIKGNNNKHNTSIEKSEIQAIDNKFKNIILSNRDMIIYFCLVIQEFNQFFSVQLTEAQISSSLHMFSGSFVELMTGSGKTFAIALAVVWYVKLEKKKVHVATFTSYLSSRDLAELKPFYRFLFISSSEINEKDYEYSDVIYGDISSFVFAYLSFINIKESADIVSKYLNVMILDESDGILVEKDLVQHISSTNINILEGRDENKKSLLLKLSPYSLNMFFNEINDEFQLSKDYFNIGVVSENQLPTPSITGDGIKKLNKILENNQFKFFKSRPGSIYFLTLSVLNAKLKRINIDYTVEMNEMLPDRKIPSVIPIDTYSGEKNLLSRFSYLEHEILEIQNDLLDVNDKETFFNKSKYSSSMNIYTYLRFYDHCIGISGTNLEIRDMIKNLLNKETVKITQEFSGQKKNIYLNTFYSIEEKKEYLKKQIEKYFPRPMLILTDNSKVNRLLYSFLKKNILFLNKKNLVILDVLNEHKKSMIIDRKAGKEGFIIVSTNIISRGIDIKVTHRLQKEFIYFKSWYREKQLYILDSLDGHKCYIFEKIIEVFNKELEKFKIRNQGLIIFLFQPYLDRRLDKQAIGRTARMGQDGTIHKLFSFDDDIVSVKKEKSSPFSILNIFFPILSWIKKSSKKSILFKPMKKFFNNFNLDKVIFLFVRRIQNINYIFSTGNSQEEKLKDLLINGFIKKKIFLIHTDPQSLISFLSKIKKIITRLTVFDKNIIFNNIDDFAKKTLNLSSVNDVLFYIENFILKNDVFFSKNFSSQEFLIKSGFLGNWKVITGLINSVKNKSNDQNYDYVSEYFLFVYSVTLNSLIEKILLIKKNM